MDEISKNNFNAIQEAINTLNVKLENQEKRLSQYVTTIQMLQTTINSLQQEMMLLKASGYNSGPTVK